MHSKSPAQIEERVQQAERTLADLRDITQKIEKEVALLRADFERLRVETQQAVGAKLP